MCLTDHTNKIKLENRQLRKELLELIRKTRALQQHKHELEDQRRQLIREQQYSGDLKKLRTTRQHKVFKSFGLLGEGEGEENNLLAIEEEKSPTDSVPSWIILFCIHVPLHDPQILNSTRQKALGNIVAKVVNACKQNLLLL